MDQGLEGVFLLVMAMNEEGGQKGTEVSIVVNWRTATFVFGVSPS